MLAYLAIGELSCFEKLLLPRVLMGDTGGRTTYLDEIFGPLGQSQHGEMLVHTLIAFAQSGFRLKFTAQQLHIHPKSIKYRLQHVAAIPGIDCYHPETRCSFT